MLLISGCASLPIKYPIESSKVEISGNKIIVDGKPFAELRYYVRRPETSNNYRGLSIYYYNNKEEVWICPEDKDRIFFDTKRKKYIYKYKSQSDMYFGWLKNIIISPDGKYVFFTRNGFIYDSDYKYLVEYGVVE